MKEIITGSLGYDYIMNFPGRFADRIMPDKLHQISLSFLADKLTKNIGGTAGNLAYTLKLLGAEPHIVSTAGNDFDEYRKFLDSHRIATAGIRVVPNEPTSSYHVVTDRDDNQIGAFYTGAMKYNKELTLQGDSLKEIEFVVVGPNDPDAMKTYIKECRAKNLRYMYDPAFQIDNMTADELTFAIEGAELLIGNDYEIALIEKKLEISHEDLLVMGPKAVITTLGAKGSIIETRHDAIHVKSAKPKTVSDPTGAGDAYRAGFLAGYLSALKKLSFEGSKKLSFDEASSHITADDLLVCGQMGSVAAVYTVEKYGTVTHHFTKEEFSKRYKENYGTDLIL
ncbi:MAG TPA: PfkB family carbohydrate kinase [Patescibacteria group bacterium]|nr:PfkB family carbohydrate kinase [Patescibacteria group bacterium]